MNRLQTDFLCPRSTFVGGMGSVLNLGGEYFDYNTSADPDVLALFMDWAKVGDDITAALVESEKETATP